MQPGFREIIRDEVGERGVEQLEREMGYRDEVIIDGCWQGEHGYCVRVRYGGGVLVYVAGVWRP